MPIFRTELANENWHNKYRYKGETPLETFQRVARALASVEKNPALWEDKFLHTLVKFGTGDDEGDPIGLKCTTGGRITANIGTDYKRATLMNCYISGPVSGATINYKRKTADGKVGHDVTMMTDESPDDLVNIFLTLMEQAKTLASEGGYGMNFDWIRPRGALIKGTGIKHPGVVSYMKVWDAVSECIVKGTNDGYVDRLTNYLNMTEDLLGDNFDAAKQAMKAVKVMTRKGAMMGALSCWHPDIEEFVRAKQSSGVLTKFNISVLMDDDFLQCVEKDSLYQLEFEGTVYKVVKARELYDLIMESCYNRGEPGVLFVDNMHRNNPVSYLGKATCSNPCGEIPGLAALTTVCLLGSLNMTQYVEIGERRKPYFDWETYQEDIKVLARMLDNVNDLTYNSLPSYQWATKNLRQFGMGLNGLGSALIMLGIPYNSKRARDFVEKACSLKENLTWQASALLAKEKGTFPAYNKRAFERTEYFKSDRITDETKKMLRKYGARNAKTTTNPPLGNSSVICNNVSNGIEPLFDLEYERVVVAKEWPEGLNEENIRDYLEHYKEKDYEYWRGVYAGFTYHYEPKNRGLCRVHVERDYGYQWVLENFPNKDHSKYLKTTDDLSIDDHINIQSIVQRYCNQSVSKCLAEGQIVETNKGPRKIEEFLDMIPSKEGFYSCKDLQVFDIEGNLVPVNRAYYGGKKEAVRIRVDNGSEVCCSTEHRFLTPEGWKSSNTLRVGDFILVNNPKYVHSSGGMSIPFNVDDLNLHYYKEIRLPDCMSEDLALFLGMLAADGHVAWPSVSLTEKDKVVGRTFDRLSKKLFGRTPKVGTDKRNGVRSHTINSVPLVYFLQKLLKGSRSWDKRVPDCVLYGSEEEKRAFIKGISLDGYYVDKRKALCVYEGLSKGMARDLELICRQFSCYETSFRRKKVHKREYFTYAVETFFPFECLEKHKNRKVHPKNWYVLIEKETLDNFKPGRKNYSGQGLKCRRATRLYRNSAEKNGLPYRFLTRITDIDEIGKKKMYDIEVPRSSHTYLVSGLVTHNTSNLSFDYPFKDFKNLYLKAWKKGLNGFTTYRKGSMEAVMSDIKEAEKSREIISRDIKLPDVFLNGPMRIIKKEGYKFYINFSYLPEDSKMEFPVVMWIQTNAKYKGDELRTCNMAARNLGKLALARGIDEGIVKETVVKARTDYPHNRLGRLVSLCLRHNIPRQDILISLMNIDGDNISTLLTAVRKFLAQTLDDGTVLKGVKCENPNCTGTGDNVVMESGCKKCKDCGWSGCG